MKLTEISNLESKTLNTLAKNMAAAQIHWSEYAAVLGRIEDEKLYNEYGYGSTVKYAEDEMKLSVGSVLTYLGLWKAMRQSGLKLDVWSELPITYAQQIKRIITAGGDATRWIQIAKETKSITEFRTKVSAFVGNAEEFQTFKAAVPTELLEMIHLELERALPEATGRPDSPAAMVHHRSTRFRCLEVIFRHFSQTYEVPEHP